MLCFYRYQALYWPVSQSNRWSEVKQFLCLFRSSILWNIHFCQNGKSPTSMTSLTMAYTFFPQAMKDDPLDISLNNITNSRHFYCYLFCKVISDSTTSSNKYWCFLMTLKSEQKNQQKEWLILFRYIQKCLQPQVDVGGRSSSYLFVMGAEVRNRD